MRGYECDGCGIASCDLPDEIDPNMFFVIDYNSVFCMGCAPEDLIT